MLPLMIAGGAMMAGGTAANIFGTMQRDKAQKRAMKDYQNAVNAHSAEEQQSLQEQSGILSGFARERQTGVGQYLDQMQAAERPDDAGNARFRQNQQGALTDIAKQTGGAQSGYSYQGAPRSGAEGQQAEITGAKNSRLAEAMLADHQLRAINEKQTNAAHTKTLADLMRQGRGKTTADRFQLAKALRDLDWQKKTAALQGQLDAAGRKGEWANILGGLSTQIGGMAMTAGMMGGPGAAAGGAAGASSLAGNTSVAQGMAEAPLGGWATNAPGLT